MLLPQDEISRFKIMQNELEIKQAVELARELHKDQKRKNTNAPYFEHLAGVASLVKSGGGSNDQIIAAFLHDAIEDQGDKITIKKIDEMFGSVVSGIILDCSENKELDKPARKRHYIKNIENAYVRPQSLLIITADKIHNVESMIRDYLLMGDSIWDSFSSGVSTTIEFYKNVTTALREVSGNNFPLLDRLERSVKILESIGENYGKANNRKYEAH